MGWWRQSGYGVDTTTGMPVVVHAERRGRRWVYTALDADVPAGVPALAAALSVRDGFARWVDAPFASFRKSRKVLPTVLDVGLPFDLEDCFYTFPDFRRLPGGGMRVLGVVARQTTVAKRLENLRVQGVDPELLDYEGLALWSQSLLEYPGLQAMPDGWRIVIWLCGDLSVLVVGRAGVFLNAHGVRAGDMAQLRRLVHGYWPDARPPAALQWCWAGPDLQKNTDVARIYPGLSGEMGGAHQVHDAPHLFLARALAVRAAGGGVVPCNLRLGVCAHPRAVSRGRMWRHGVARAAVVAGVLLCGMAIGAMCYMKIRTARMEQGFHRECSRLAGFDIGGARGEHALRMVRDAAVQKNTGQDRFLRLMASTLTADVADVMRVGAELDVRISELEMAEGRVVVRGATREWKAPERLLAMLQAKGYAAALQRGDALSDQWIAFSIDAGGAP